MVVNLLLIAHHFTIGLHPTDYKIGYNPFPTSSPNKKLRFEIKAIRHPLERAGDAGAAEPAGVATRAGVEAFSRPAANR